MTKQWFRRLAGFFVVTLLSGVTLVSAEDVIGNETNVQTLSSNQIAAAVEVVAADQEEVSTNVAGLTPKKANRTPKSVVLAQQPPKAKLISSERLSIPSAFKTVESSNEEISKSVEVGQQTTGMVVPETLPSAIYVAEGPAAPLDASDAYVHSELNRLTKEIDKLKKDTKKPDTKKVWGAPKVSGRIFLDAYSASNSQNAPNYVNKAGMRDFQLAASGTGFDIFDYKLEIGLPTSGGAVTIVDNWLGIKNIPLFGYVRAGHYKPETGLNYPASSLATDLTEFSGPASTFGLGRRIGVSSETLYCKDRVRLFYGFFQEGATNLDRYIQQNEQGNVLNMRLSAAPIYKEDGKYLLHIGSSWSYVNTNTGTTSLSMQPGGIGWYTASLGTGNFMNQHNNRYGLEAAFQANRLAVQSEAFWAQFDGFGTQKSNNAFGAYVTFKYFLSNAFRSYDLKKGMFSSVKQKCNFHTVSECDRFFIDGWGAWQAVMTFSYLDLNDWRATTARAGDQNDITLGLNWFLTPNIRWIFEYVHSEQNIGTTHRNASEEILGTSLRFHF
ncbi:MAG: OprO/OprP family phosphate-selective porin [Thermoguttaceae bacterium]